MVGGMKDATREKWTRRVEEWRASGEEAKEFAKRTGDFEPGTLRFWASKLKREPPGAAAPSGRDVRLARVVRRPISSGSLGRDAMIMIDALSASVRVVVPTGADRGTLAMVLAVLGLGVPR